MSGGGSEIKTITGLAVRIDEKGRPVLTWSAISGASGYYAVRWKVDDPACCANGSAQAAPLTVTSWQDEPLPKAGDYAFSVAAVNSAGSPVAVGEVRRGWTGSTGGGAVAPSPPPPPPPSPGSAAPLAPRTVTLGGFNGAGGFGSLAPRTVTLGGFAGAGGFGSLAPRTVTLGGFNGAGGFGSLAPRTVTLGGFTAGGGFNNLAPRTVALPGFTAVGTVRQSAPPARVPPPPPPPGQPSPPVSPPWPPPPSQFPPPPLPPAIPGQGRYWVEISTLGYTGLAKNLDCDAIARNGWDYMEGMVTGPLSVSPGTDPVFRGLLRRATDIDYCLLKGSDGQEKWCTASLDGEAWMNVELTVYAGAGRGAWLTATPEPGTLKRLNVSGDCESADVAEIRRDYPSGSSGGSPSGQPIAEGVGPLGSMFRNSAGTRGLAVPGTYLRNPPETVWSILVTSIVPP